MPLKYEGDIVLTAVVDIVTHRILYDSNNLCVSSKWPE